MASVTPSVTPQQIESFFQRNGDFIGYGENMNYMVYHGAEALNKYDLWHWIKTFDPKYGFVNSHNTNTQRFQNEVNVRDDHTGTSMACTMRFLQRISKELIEGDGPDVLCPVCQCDEYHGDKTSLECGHMFHRGCIESWHGSGAHGGKPTCPSCRGDTVPTFSTT